MAKVVSAITATVEVIGKLKDGNYGPYRSVLFLDQAQPVGSEASKIWKSLSEAEAAPLSKGARVQLVPAGKDRSGKDKHNIVLLEGQTQAVSASTGQPQSPIPPTPAPVRPSKIPPTWTDEQKREMSAAICDHADVLRFCLEVVQHKFAGVAEPREYRAIATTLYIQMMKQTPWSNSVEDGQDN